MICKSLHRKLNIEQHKPNKKTGDKLLTNVVCEFKTLSSVVYPIQYDMIKFVSDLWQVRGFLRGTPVSSTNKTDRHDINKILLNVVLNTITLNPNQQPHA